MNVLMLDVTSSLLDLALRADAWGHHVKVWQPVGHDGKGCCIGDGLVAKVEDWEPWMKWADLIVLSDNARYRRSIEPFFQQGFPIFGANMASAELELDRGAGQAMFEKRGIKVLPYEVFSSYDKAIAYVRKQDRAFVSKPWGGASDKGLSFVAKSPEDLIYKLEHWREVGKLRGEFMLQEKVDGVEIAVGGWFGPGGWSKHFCENFEEKGFMNGNLGGNTGEQGTVLYYTDKSKLARKLLIPLEDELLALGFVGYCDVNTIVDSRGQAWPLEFTMRFGDPTMKIQQPLHKGDPVEWMLALVEGHDRLVVEPKVSVGVVMTHGDYPHSKMTGKLVEGVPIRGLEQVHPGQLHFCDVMEGVVDGTAQPVTAGDYVLVVTGTGGSVRAAQRKAYDATWQVDWPSNRMFRTDIGDRLKEQLPELHNHGYATGITYG